MGWACGFDSYWQRDIGYGVPAYCDHPECSEEIDRGLAYVCGAEPFGVDDGCGLYFCAKHQIGPRQLCSRCFKGIAPFEPKPDHPDWVSYKRERLAVAERQAGAWRHSDAPKTTQEAINEFEPPRAQRAAPPPAPPQTWQPIETAPKDGTQLMLRMGDIVSQGWWEHESPEPMWLAWDIPIAAWKFQPTHWMPLPPAPGDGGAQ